MTFQQGGQPLNSDPGVNTSGEYDESDYTDSSVDAFAELLVEDSLNRSLTLGAIQYEQTPICGSRPPYHFPAIDDSEIPWVIPPEGEPQYLGESSFNSMKIRCPSCSHECSLQLRFLYNGLNPYNELQQEIKYRISVGRAGNDNAMGDNSPATRPHPAGPGAQGQLCPESPPYEYHGEEYQSFDRMNTKCPYCQHGLSLKTGFQYLGSDPTNPGSQEIKLRIKANKELLNRLPPSPSDQSSG